MPPLLSIVTVVLNGAETLERAFKSVFDQGFGDLDYVVIDGGSTDGTLEIIRRYESRIGYWRSEPDDGLYDAMNKGVRAARGRWVLFLGADDVLVARLGEIASMLTDERTIYYGDVYMPRRQQIYDGPFSAYKIMFANICHQAIFYPRRVFELHRFDTRYRLWADHALNIACYGDKRLRFVYIGKLVCLFNDHSGATAYATDARFEADREALIRAHLPLRLYIAYLLRTRIGRLRRWLGLVRRGLI
jgi:glycosyltransferase involved in cell wall biosynthesis